MDATEHHVERFLLSKGYQKEEIVYEPDGNVPPDFLLQNRIAVEVRRLNQNYEGGVKGTKGLEETAIPFRDKMKKLVESFGPPVGEHSWIVSCHLTRPEIPWPTLKPMFKKVFSEFARDPAAMPSDYIFGTSLKVSIVASSQKFNSFFVMGSHIDRQAGGWVLQKIVRNIEICTSEKTTKIAKYKASYPEWWLILVDRIAPELLDSDDIAFIREHVPDKQGWTRIVIVDSIDCSRSFEL